MSSPLADSTQEIHLHSAKIGPNDVYRRSNGSGEKEGRRRGMFKGFSLVFFVVFFQSP